MRPRCGRTCACRSASHGLERGHQVFQVVGAHVLKTHLADVFQSIGQFFPVLFGGAGRDFMLPRCQRAAYSATVTLSGSPIRPRE